MTTIAHLSDLHLLEDSHASRRGADRLRLAYLMLARPADPARRRRRALRALSQAWISGASHLVITGDLTEDGTDAQFEVLASILASSRWPASRVTLVPGNHDAYASAGAWARALAGPLRPYAATSASGSVTRVDGALLVAVSTALDQPVTRSAGAIEKDDLEAIAHAAAEARRSALAVVIAQHHPPRRYVLPPAQWIHGLRQHEELTEILLAHDHAHVLHGHTHDARDRSVRSGAQARIFSAEAVVDSASPLRLYRVEHGRLLPDATPLLVGEEMMAAAS